MTRGNSEGIVEDISDGNVVVMIEGLFDDGVIEGAVVETNVGKRDGSTDVA